MKAPTKLKDLVTIFRNRWEHDVLESIDRGKSFFAVIFKTVDEILNRLESGVNKKCNFKCFTGYDPYSNTSIFGPPPNCCALNEVVYHHGSFYHRRDVVFVGAESGF